MSPLDRLDWLSEVAQDETLPASSVRVAIALVKFINQETGSCYPAKETLGKMLGIDARAVRRAVGALQGAGLLKVKQSPGRVCCQYKPIIPDNSTRVNLPGFNDSTRTIRVSQPGQKTKTTRVKLPSKQGRNKERTGEEALDPLQRLRKSGAHLNRSGESIAQEWQELIDAHDIDAVLVALSKLPPKDKWPSRVRSRLELAADLPGLVEVTDRDRVLAALGLPAQNEDEPISNQPNRDEIATTAKQMALVEAV
jgi:hypothetical protein